MHDKPLAFSLQDAAVRLGVSRTTMYEEINRGRLLSFKVGAKRMVSSHALDQYIRDREAATGPRELPPSRSQPRVSRRSRQQHTGGGLG